MISLTSFALGRLCRDRTFSAEEHIIGGDWQVGCDIGNRQVLLQKMESKSWLSFDIDSEVRVRYLAHHVIALAASPRSSQHLVFLEAHSPPLFETTSSSILGDSSARLPAINERKEMPPVVRCICLMFRTRDDQQTFLKSCRELHLPRPTEIDLTVVKKNLYSKNNLLRLDHFYRQLCFGLAFEAQKSLTSGILDPLQLLVSLKEDMLQLQQESEYHAVAIFCQFTSNLKVPTFARKQGRRRRRRPDPFTPGDFTLQSILRETASQYHAGLAQTRNIFSPSPAVVQSYHLIVTPSSWFPEGPLPDKGNCESRCLASLHPTLDCCFLSAVLRRFGHHECFLRVSFSDESRSRLYHRVGLNAQESIGKRYLELMVNGFQLAGRKWEFLGYSMSGLREHSVWFVNPFQSDDEPSILMDAARIRSLLVSTILS
jgi:RNA-dependent RNA polymerase